MSSVLWDVFYWMVAFIKLLFTLIIHFGAIMFNHTHTHTHARAHRLNTGITSWRYDFNLGYNKYKHLIRDLVKKQWVITDVLLRIHGYLWILFVVLLSFSSLWMNGVIYIIRLYFHYVLFFIYNGVIYTIIVLYSFIDLCLSIDSYILFILHFLYPFIHSFIHPLNGFVSSL